LWRLCAKVPSSMMSPTRKAPCSRSANTGISAIVDPRGRIRERSAIFTEAALVGQIQAQAEPTPYTRVGDLFAWIAAAGSAAAVLRRCPG
jgi:apolipoprotein N-acyltransferase